MNLNQEISLDMFKRKKKDGSDTASLKTTINLVGQKEDTTNWGLAVPGVILVVAAAVLFAKFGVVDRFARQSAAEAEVSRLRAQLEAGIEELDSGGELSERFYHYTWSGMTEEEVDRVSRVQIAELISFIGSYNVSVQSYVLNGSDVSVTITAPRLETVSQLAEALRAQEIVSTCSVTTAQTNETTTYETNEDGETIETGADGQVNAQLMISIRTLSEIAEEAAE